MPMHSSSLQTRTRRSAASLAIGRKRPALVTISGTESTNSTPLAFMAAMMLEPWSSTLAASRAAAVCASMEPPIRAHLWCLRELPNAKSVPDATNLLGAGDARLLHDLAPAARLRLDEAIELLGRALADRDELKVDELLAHFRLSDGGVHGGVELRHHLLGRAARHRDRLPGGPVEARQADLGERRDFGRRRGALHRGEPERA